VAFRNMEHHHRSTLKQVFTLTILHDPCDSLGLVPQSVLWAVMISRLSANESRTSNFSQQPVECR
jgi:hypothetical protein